MSESIGESLGIILALFEQELREDPDNFAMLERIQKISEIYRNFAECDFDGFRADFDKGYEAGKVFNRQDTAPLPPPFGDAGPNEPHMG